MKQYYYLDANNNPVGPYSEEQLKQLHLSNVVKPNTQIAEAGGSTWQPYANLLVLGSPAGSPSALPPLPGTVGPSVNHKPTEIGTAILWFLCCIPIGFMQWNQSLKGWLWVLISIATGGFGAIPAWIDYFMCFSAQQKRPLGEWEFFPK